MTVEGALGSPNIIVGVIACFGGMFVHLVIGSLYQWGIINIYITSYYRIKDPTLTEQSTEIAFPLMMMCIGLTMKVGLTLAKKSHPLIVLIVGQFLNSAMIFISSFMPNIYLFILFYGIFFGLTAGMNFTNALLECNKYLVGKKMYVNGLILVGTGSGSVIFGLFSYYFLNPKELKPLNGYYFGNPTLEAIVEQCPVLLRWLSLMYLLIGLLGTSMMAPVCIYNRKKENLEKEKKREEEENKSNREKTIELSVRTTTRNALETKEINFVNELKKTGEAHSIKEAIFSKIFWITTLIVILASCGCFLINGNYITYVNGRINDDHFLTIIGVVGAIGNGCSRFFWNLYFSKTGFKTVSLTIFTICIITLSTIRFTSEIKQVYLISVFFMNSCLGGLFVLIPTSALYIYGIKTGTSIYGIYWEAFTLANFIEYIYVSQLSKLIDFNGIIYVCLGMCICAVPFVLFTKIQGPWKNDTVHLEYLLSREEGKKEKLLSESTVNDELIK